MVVTDPDGPDGRGVLPVDERPCCRAWDSPTPITNGRVGSMTEGPDSTVLLATYGQFGTPPGLWLGTWQNGQLGFDRVAVGDTDRMRRIRTVIARRAGRRLDDDHLRR